MMVGEVEDGNTAAEQRIDGSIFQASQIGRLKKNYFLAVPEPNLAPSFQTHCFQISLRSDPQL
jgi:hypothetical protein